MKHVFTLQAFSDMLAWHGDLVGQGSSTDRGVVHAVVTQDRHLGHPHVGGRVELGMKRNWAPRGGNMYPSM